MLCSICSRLFDWSGVHLFDVNVADSDLATTKRRVSRTATLDGGCVVVDNGFTVSDATLQIALPVGMDEDTVKALESTLQLHSELTVSVDGACYAGVAEAATWGDKRKIKVLVTEKLNG